MNNLSLKLHHGQERMARELRGLIDDAEGLLRHAVRDAGSEFTQARERLERNMNAAKARLAGADDAVIDGIGDLARVTDEFVHRKPWVTIGIVTGLSLLAVALIARR